MIDDPKVRLFYKILAMKLPSSNTTTTFQCDLLNEICNNLVITSNAVDAVDFACMCLCVYVQSIFCF